MNFSEYKRRLNAEPNCEDPELLAARDSDPRFAEAAADAAAFEAKLEQAREMLGPSLGIQLYTQCTRKNRELLDRSGTTILTLISKWPML